MELPALELESPFNETELLQQHMDFVLRDLGIATVKFTPSTEGPALVVPAPAQMTPAEQQVQIEALGASKALPGRPSPYFYKKSA